MPYKCEYDYKFGCENCKHSEENGIVKCKMENKDEIECIHLSCPVVRGSEYPKDEYCCDMCMFEPKEDDKKMIVIEEELDELLERCESQIRGLQLKAKENDLITISLRKDQLKNIVEFIEFEFVPFVRREDSDVDNIWYLESMSTAYATLLKALKGSDNNV